MDTEFASQFGCDSWVPPAIAERAYRLHSEFREDNDEDGLAILQRLTSDKRMKRVWEEVYKRKRSRYASTHEYLYPGRVTNRTWAMIHKQQAVELRKVGGVRNLQQAALLEREAAIEESLSDLAEDPHLTEQDLAAQRLLCHACHSAIQIEPIFLSQLSDQAKKTYQTKAKGRYPAADDPWIIARNHGNAEARTFVADLSISTTMLFGKPLYRTLATVANVVFLRNDITRPVIWEWLRDRDR